MPTVEGEELLREMRAREEELARARSEEGSADQPGQNPERVREERIAWVNATMANLKAEVRSAKPEHARLQLCSFPLYVQGVRTYAQEGREATLAGEARLKVDLLGEKIGIPDLASRVRLAIDDLHGGSETCSVLIGFSDLRSLLQGPQA